MTTYSPTAQVVTTLTAHTLTQSTMAAQSMTLPATSALLEQCNLILERVAARPDRVGLFDLHDVLMSLPDSLFPQGAALLTTILFNSLRYNKTAAMPLLDALCTHPNTHIEQITLSSKLRRLQPTRSQCLPSTMFQSRVV